MTTMLELASRLVPDLRVAELEREIAKLRRINAALMGRVERSMDAQGSAFSLFQTAIVLETKVRERTAELEHTLSKLERSYGEVAAAKEQFETAQTRLMAAIGSISEGFALFDAQDRLVLFNPRYLSFWPGISNRIHAGIPFRDIVRMAAEHKAVVDAYDDSDGWVRRRLQLHADPQGPSVHALSDGRWMQVNERRTGDGGIVSVYTDISDLKRRETLQRETELAEKTSLLQATLDNFFEGVAVYDRDFVLVAWNNEFMRLFELPLRVVDSGARFVDFAAYIDALGAQGALLCRHLAPPARTPLHLEIAWLDGRFLATQRNAMPDGGFVLTFRDITRRKRTEEALTEANETLERRVEERTAALTVLNEKLQQEIAERREIQAALQVAKSEAEQANLGKTKFLAAASHDLLQPLNAARLFVSALSEAEQGRRNRELIENVDESLGAVEDLLGALLDISKLDAGAVSPEIIDFEIGSLLASLTTEYTVLARERGLELRSVISHCAVRCDVRLLRRILQNLLANAIRYTQSGRVLLGSRRTRAGLRIEVWDTGSGIPAEKFDEIFEEFRQLHNAPSRQDGGIGLGLAIVRRIARMVDVPVTVRSTVGRGSVFAVAVPYGYATAALPRIPQRSVPEQRLSETLVMVIDNEPGILAGMSALLGAWDCRTCVAGSGEEALKLLPSLPTPPDLVMIDYHLDGGALGISEYMRIARACARALPCIIVTANRSESVKEAARQHGCRILNKPVKPAQLRALMIQMLSDADRVRSERAGPGQLSAS